MRNDPLVIFGGTFDPIHFGHLRTALEIKEYLDVDCVRLIPTGEPVHRGATQASAKQRFTMAEKSVCDEPALQIDDIEQRGEIDGYTVNTVSHLRQGIGREQSLIMVLGMDSFLSLPSWHRWQELLDYTHLLIVSRPGYRFELTSELKIFYEANLCKNVNDLKMSPSGKILIQEFTAVDISATAIRNIIRSGKSPRFLLPDAAWDFIKREHLYGVNKR